MKTPQTKWMFSYRRTGSRELTQAERESFGRRARRVRVRSLGWGVLAIISFVLASGFVVLASDGVKWWWLAALAAIVGFFKLLAMANANEGFALLYRRVARRGKLDRYEPADRPEHGRLSPPESDEEDGVPQPYWLHDEKFEEQLVRICGHRPAWFETPAEDDVLATVEGQPIAKVHNVISAFVAERET